MADDLRRRFGRLARDNILANLTVPLAGLVDLAMLGHLPDIRFLAGVALGGVVFDYVYWSFGFLRMGTTGTTAQALGRDDPGEVFGTLYRNLALALAIGVALVLLRAPLGTLAFELLAGAPGVEAAGLDYYRARIWGAPATLAGLVFLGWFLGREESRVALWLVASANLANIGLNYLLIIHLGLAARGAGLATMLSQYLLVTLALVFYLRRRREPGPDRWPWRRLFAGGALGEMLRLHRDILVRTLCLTTAFALFTNISAAIGTAVLAANAVLLRVVSTGAYLIDGAAYATETLAGRLHGAGDPARLRRLLGYALRVGFAFAGAILFAVLLFPEPLLGLLTSHRDVVADAAASRWWLLPTLLFGAPAYIYDGYFLGLTAGATLRNAMLIAGGLVFLPVAAAAWLRHDAALLWLALALFMVARSVLLARAEMRLARA